MSSKPTLNPFKILPLQLYLSQFYAMNSGDGKKIVQNLHTLAYNYGLFIKGLFLVEVIPCKLFHQKKNKLFF